MWLRRHAGVRLGQTQAWELLRRAHRALAERPV
jgi:hypothetical protein